jgi:hypothetical protein
MASATIVARLKGGASDIQSCSSETSGYKELQLNPIFFSI